MLVACLCFKGNGQQTTELSKGPISFSIKNKDGKKPKIEYRTSVIYKQSCEQGESDEDEQENNEEQKETEENENRPLDAKGQDSCSTSEQQEKNEPSTADLRQQMESIEAAERIGGYHNCLIMHCTLHNETSVITQIA